MSIIKKANMRQEGKKRKPTNNNVSWKGCGQWGAFIHVRVSAYQDSHSVSVKVSQRAKNKTTMLSNNSTPGHISKRFYIPLHRNLFIHVHCCSVHSIKEMKLTQMSFNRCMEYENVVHIHNLILFIHEEKMKVCNLQEK